MFTAISKARDLFSDIRPEYADHSIKTGIATGIITNEDAGFLRTFISERRAAAGISQGRANKLSFTLVSWRRFLGSYKDLTITDVYTGIEAMKVGKSRRGKCFKPNTIADHVVILKQFILWMIDEGHSTIAEKKIRSIKIPKRDLVTKKANDLLTPEEITTIVAACKRSEDRALIMLLYEGGFRIGEIAQMTWGDLTFEHGGVSTSVQFKTSFTRHIKTFMCTEYLKTWRADYPGTPEGSSNIFVNELGKPFIHGTISKRIDRIVKRSGITKHVTPHLFRHSRITHMINDGVQESIIKMMMWGSVNTTMFKTYAHLTGKDIDNEIARVYGLIKPEEKKLEVRVIPRQCPHCQHINPPTTDWCYGCGESLNPTNIATEEQIQQFISQHGRELAEYLTNMNKRAEISCRA